MLYVMSIMRFALTTYRVTIYKQMYGLEKMIRTCTYVTMRVRLGPFHLAHLQTYVVQNEADCVVEHAVPAGIRTYICTYVSRSKHITVGQVTIR